MSFTPPVSELTAVAARALYLTGKYEGCARNIRLEHGEGFLRAGENMRVKGNKKGKVPTSVTPRLKLQMKGSRLKSMWCYFSDDSD